MVAKISAEITFSKIDAFDYNVRIEEFEKFINDA
jgi:hypothetical protein